MSRTMSHKVRKATEVNPNQVANELSEVELNAVSGGMRKSAGNQASGVMFLSFSFVAV